MVGTRQGGLKAAACNRAKYGDDFYKRIGSKGGSAFTDKLKGFANNPELAKKVGRKIGLRTRRGYKWLGDVDDTHGKYQNLETGEISIKEYSRSVNED